MEYRSLFETDTETILNELTSLEQQQQQQPVYNATNTTGGPTTAATGVPGPGGGGGGPMVNANGTHMQSSYSSQNQAYQQQQPPQQQQQHPTPNQASNQPTPQQQQQPHMAQSYMMQQQQQQQQYGNYSSPMMLQQQQQQQQQKAGYMNSTMPPPGQADYMNSGKPMPNQYNATQANNGMMNSTVAWSAGSNANAPNSANQVPGAYATPNAQQPYKPQQNPNMMMSSPMAQPQQPPMVYKMNNQFAPNANSPKAPTTMYQAQGPPGLGAPTAPNQMMMNQSQQPIIIKQQPMPMGSQFAPGTTTLNSTNQTVNMTSSLPQQHSTYYAQSGQQQLPSGPKQLSSLPPHMQQPSQQYNAYNNTSPSPQNQMSPQPRPMMPQQPMQQQQQQAYQPSPNKLPPQAGLPGASTMTPGGAAPNAGMVPASAIHHHMGPNAPGQQLSPNRTPMAGQPSYYPNAQSNYPQQTPMYPQANSQYGQPQQPHTFSNYSSNTQAPNAGAAGIGGANGPYTTNSTNSYYNSQLPSAAPSAGPSVAAVAPPMNSYSSMDVDSILTANISTTSSASSAISPTAEAASGNGDASGPAKTGRGKGKAAKNNNNNSATVNDSSDMLNTSSDESFNAGKPKAKGKRATSKKKEQEQAAAAAAAASADSVSASPGQPQPNAAMYPPAQPGQPPHGVMVNHQASPLSSPASNAPLNRPPANMAALTIQRHDLTGSTQPALSPNNGGMGGYASSAQSAMPPPSMAPPQQGMPTNATTNPNYGGQPGQPTGYHPQPQQQHMNYPNGQTVMVMANNQGMHAGPGGAHQMGQMPQMMSNGPAGYAPQQQQQQPPQQFMKKPDGTPADPALLYSNNSSLQHMKQMGASAAAHGPMGMMPGAGAGPNAGGQPMMMAGQAQQAPGQPGAYMKPPMGHPFQQPAAPHYPPQQQQQQQQTGLPSISEMSGPGQAPGHMHHPHGPAPGAPMSAYPAQSQPGTGVGAYAGMQPPHYPQQQQQGGMMNNGMTNGMAPQPGQHQQYSMMPTGQMVSPYPPGDPSKMSMQAPSAFPPQHDPSTTLVNTTSNNNNNNGAAPAETKSPKKLTKKQQQQLLAAGEIDANGVQTSPNKKSPRSKSAKKANASSLDNSMSSSSSMTDLAGATSNGVVYSVADPSKPLNESDMNAIDAKGDTNLSAQTHARIDATIDDFMKQYKMKKKTKAKSKAAKDEQQSGDENGDAGEEDSDKDESFHGGDASDDDENEEKEDDESPVKKGKARKPRASKKKKDADLDSTDAGAEDGGKKKRRAPKRTKVSTLLLDDQQSMQTGDSSDVGLTTVRLTSFGDDSLSMTPGEFPAKKRGPKAKGVSIDPSTPGGADSELSTPAAAVAPIITTPSNRGRRKSTQHLAKLLKKKQKKKRKRTSSGEDEGEEDDSADDFELSCSTAAALSKKKEKEQAAPVGSDEASASQTNGETAEGGADDEATAKALQANENKRRSTRATAAKRTKYSDEDYKLKDEDLLMPLTEAEIAAEAAAAAAAENGANIVLSTPDSFIVDKILGIRLVKRKTYRKKEKKSKPVEEPPKATEEPAKPIEEAAKAPEKVDEEVKVEGETKVEEETKVEADAKPATPKTETKEPEEATVVEAEKTAEAAKTADQEEAVTKMEESSAPVEATEPSAEPAAPAKEEEEVKQESEAAEPAAEKAKESEEPAQMEVDSKPVEESKPAEEKPATPVEKSAEEVAEKPASPVKEEQEKTSETETPASTDATAAAAVEPEAPKKEPEPEPSTVAEEDEESEYEEDGGEVEVEEFFVKYKNYSYLHCDWRTRDELFETDKRIDQKIKRFKLKKTQSLQMYFDWCDDENGNSIYNNDYDELFNPDYVEIDRILDTYDMDDPAGGPDKVRYFLIKWKSLPYDESSWEVESDVKNKKKIEQFYRINTFNPDVHLKLVPRPKPEKWRPVDPKHVYKNGNTLREYQIEGISWLAFCWLNGRNCILADEMGLGKTVQSVTFLQEMAFHGVRGPYLVLVPLSTIGNWNREFETWTDFNVIVYHGSSASRQLLQDYEFYFKPEAVKGETNKKNVVKFNALITTYEVLLSDVQLFCQFKWRSCIIDEAHRLKNKNCKLMEGLRYMDVEHKVLLTGTPLQNNVEELFSLLHFLEPQQFNSSVEFMQEFGDLKTDTQVTKLQAVLKPMMLRRLKEDVEKNLAPKEETIVEVELTNTQKKYYRAILEKNFQFLARGTTAANMPNLMNTMMELRKCCNHPYLINGAEDTIMAEYLEQKKQQAAAAVQEPEAAKTSDPNEANVGLKAMVQASGKLVLVDKLLPKLKAGGHKVLIFSQMIRVLDILEDYLIQMRFTYERLDGRVRGESRQEAIDRYSKPDSDRFAFLLCTRAGGLGINLTAADTVIIYDSDWNPQNDLQAQARCHRIGQRKSVKIYRLITRNTYEREMFDRASLKLGLDKAILQSMRNEHGQAAGNNREMQLSKKEIEDLLKKGAYGAIMEDDNAGDKFCEEDIDKILQQRSTVIQIEGGEKGSTFSKASFQTSETSDISIDDPEFWQKWAKKADVDIEEKLNPKDERIIYEPRRRTQTRRYGGLDEIESDYSSSDDENGGPGGENKENAAGGGKDGKGRRGKRKKRGEDANGDSDFVGEGGAAHDDQAGGDQGPLVWSRDECYKVEKNLMVFGWQRWSKILKHCAFSQRKKGGVQTEQDVESLARAILAYAIKNYHGGDDSLKQFFLELIDPAKSEFAELRGGLSGPKPRGPVVPARKGRKSAAALAAAAAANASGPTIATIAEAGETEKATEEEKSEAKEGDKTADEAKTNAGEEKTEPEEAEKKEELVEDESKKEETTASADAGAAAVATPKEETKETVVFQVPEVPGESAAEASPGEELDWAKNVDELIADENYKKHLLRQANKILLRIKTIYFIKHDIIGDELAKKIDEQDALAEEAYLNALNEAAAAGVEAVEPPLPVQDDFTSDEAFQMAEVYTDLPAEWWTHQCDKALIIGVYRHGYERYYQIRMDPRLCFLDKCGPPDAGLPPPVDEGGIEDADGKADKEDGKADETAMDVDDSNAAKESESAAKEAAAKETPAVAADDDKSKSKALKFPLDSELNNRLRRLITAVTKQKKQNELASKRELERQEKRLSKLASTQERAVMRQIEKQCKWSRREEQNFYRAISSFGVDCQDKATNLYAWERFKEIGQLDKKLDDTLTDYFNVFYAMCKRVCHKPSLGEYEEPALASVNGGELPQVETISEERASRCLQRIDLLNKVRHDVLRHANFDEWIGTKCMPSPDLPDWWISGKHDRELIKAAARYGIIRTEFYYVNDAEFTFKDYLAKYMRHIDELILADHKRALAASVDLSALGTVDPIQYYFQNQAKIQMTFKESVNKDADGKNSGVSKVAETKPAAPAVVEKMETDELDADTLVCKEVIESILDQIEQEDKRFDNVTMPPSCFFSSLASGLSEPGGQITSIPMILWPKDRVLVNRLEAIIQMFENNGQWPVQRNMLLMSQAQFGAGGQPGDLLSEQRKMMMSPMLGYDNNMDDLDMDNQDSNDRDDVNDSAMAAMNESAKYQKPKRGRPPKLGDLPQLGSGGLSSATASPSEPSHKIRNILNSSLEPRSSRNRSSLLVNGLDDEAKLEESLMKAKGFLEPGEISRSGGAGKTRASRGPAALLAQQELEQYENGLGGGSGDKGSPSLNKRGRGKPPKEIPQPLSPSQVSADQQSAAAAAAIASLFLGPNKDPDERIPMINIANGNRLTGNKAPKRADLPMWIIANPNYVPDQEEFLQLAAFANQAGQFNLENAQAQDAHQTRSKRGMPPPPQPSSSSNGANKAKFGGKAKADEEDDYEQEFMDAYEQRGKAAAAAANADRGRRPQQHSPSPSRSKPAEVSSPSQASSMPAPVVLVNKSNGKKISGPKVPSWKSLPGFLERNEQIYIDPSSTEQVRARFSKQNMPEIIRARLIVLPTKSGASSSNNNKPLPSKQSSGANTPSSGNRDQNKSSSQQQQQQQRDQSKGGQSSSRGGNASNGPSGSNNTGSGKSAAQPSIPQGLFDPFDPAALQMSGLSELLAAAGGSGSIDPLALPGFMAALAGAQGANPSFSGPGGAFNPFLFPSFNGAGPGAAASSSAAASNFQPSFADLLKELGNGKLPPGFDMSSLDEFAAMAAGLGAGGGATSNSPSIEQMKSSKIPQSSKDQNNKGQPSKEKEGLRSSNDNKNKSNQSSSSGQQSGRELRDNRDAKNGRPNPQSGNNNGNSKLPVPTSGSKNNQQPSSSKDGSKNAPPSNSKKSNESGSNRPQSSSASAGSGKERTPSVPDAMAAAAALSGFDPATYASMMDQDKFMQDLLNLSQFSQMGMGNPFSSLFGAGGAPGAGLFMPPSLPPPMMPPSGNAASSNKKGANSKSTNRASPSRQRSPSRERSVSPASSIASNISSQQQQQQQQSSADFNMFMNNFLNYPSLLGAGAGGAGGLPPSLLPSMIPGLDSSVGMMPPGMGDLSKLPVELLAALSAGGGAGLDPAMLSALMGGFGQEAAPAPSSSKEQQRGKPGQGSSSSKPSQGHSSMNKPGQSSGKHPSSSSSSNQSKSGSSSQNSRPSKPGDDQGGLDLSLKKSGSSSRNLNVKSN